MKKYLTGMFLLLGLQGWGQVDTLEFTSRRQVADSVFGLLDQNLYGNALIDRSLTEDSLLNMQLLGDYSGTSYAWSWLQSYSDIALSYTDAGYMLSDSALFHKLEEFHLNVVRERDDDSLVQPFGLLLHKVSKIDSTWYTTPNAFSNQSCQLKLNDSINESEIYSEVVLKSVALLELYGDHGYDKGTIVYDPQFISTSPDIVIHSIHLNMGSGFQPFSASNPFITYSILKDWQIGKAAVSYSIDNNSFQDTLSFYVSTKTHQYQDQEKAVERWDTGNQHFPQNGEKQLEYRIKFGCGNGRKIKRPVIIAPPYRPSQQDPPFNKYYDQFNFKSLISTLSEMGYDVIFIKETPGNRGIDHAGGILADFIKFINAQKKSNYPDEDWENVVIGYSAGGQHWRYALKKLEKEHMESGTPHHHTRLYIPFDSPHWGANVPMFAQAIYKNFSNTNIWAFFTYQSLKDAASKDMLMNHILGSTITTNNPDRIITPAPTSERLNIVNQLDNAFNHQFTPLNDLRRSFPSFTRNVAISVGGNDLDYASSETFSLTPGMTLFTQNYFTPSIFGGKYVDRSISASSYSSNASVFKHKDVYMVGFLIPVIINRHYKTYYAYEWDMAQGGYKDEFYDGYGLTIQNNINFVNGIPIGAVPILRSTQAFNILGTILGTKHYTGHISFMPTVSALGINPGIWQNNNLYYNLKDEGLMYQSKFDYDNDIRSDLFGYPNLAYPNNHFNITPFEAVYCDPQTYQHIKMQQSVSDDGLEDVYLVHTRNFILDEVEADVVYLQNKVIGKNHVQWDPNYRYKAWYKAYQDIVVGSNVSPKTDPGAYTIESTGDITMYACHEINLKPGFSAANGSNFHAFIRCDGCYRPREKNDSGSLSPNSGDVGNEAYGDVNSRMEAEEEREKELQVFPNPTTDQFTLVFPRASGHYLVSDMNGRIFEGQPVGEETKTQYLRLPKGVYFIRWVDGEAVITKKIIVL